jgi:hypothetical protein
MLAFGWTLNTRDWAIGLARIVAAALGDNMLVLSQMMNAIDGLPWFFSVAVLGLALLGRLPGTRRSAPPPTSS